MPPEWVHLFTSYLIHASISEEESWITVWNDRRRWDVDVVVVALKIIQECSPDLIWWHDIILATSRWALQCMSTCAKVWNLTFTLDVCIVGDCSWSTVRWWNTRQEAELYNIPSGCCKYCQLLRCGKITQPRHCDKWLHKSRRVVQMLLSSYQV